MAWRRILLSLLILAGASCRREAPPAEARNDAEFAVPVAAQPARRGNMRAIDGLALQALLTADREKHDVVDTRHIAAARKHLSP